MKFENPYKRKNPGLDTNLIINLLDKENQKITIISKHSDAVKITSSYSNPKNIALEINDEFEFGSKSNILGGPFQLIHLKSNEKINFFDFKTI